MVRVLLVIVLLIGAVVLVAPDPGDHGRSRSEQIASHRYGLQAATKELALHDSTTSVLIEIRAYEILEANPAKGFSEAMAQAELEVAEERDFITESIELYRILLNQSP